jgi:hypothetical protein
VKREGGFWPDDLESEIGIFVLDLEGEVADPGDL